MNETGIVSNNQFFPKGFESCVNTKGRRREGKDLKEFRGGGETSEGLAGERREGRGLCH